MWESLVPADPAEQPPLLQQASTLLQARRHLFYQEYDAAQALLADVRAQAERSNLSRLTLEILLLQALAWQACLHTRQALETFAQALVLAERGGFVRLLADEGAPLALLLAQMRQRGAEVGGVSLDAPYLDRLLTACSTTPAASTITTETPAPSLDALSAREQEVLRLLAAGLSNAEIAERLIVSPGTVKRHLHNLYSKLGVTNRTQAAACARAHMPPPDVQ
jgi:LuxR family maltose regulon positive regulatory protein